MTHPKEPMTDSEQEPERPTDAIYRRLVDLGVTPDAARHGVQQAHIDIWAARSATPVMAITQNLTPELRTAVAKALGQPTAGDDECRSFCIGLLSRAVSDLIEGRRRLPEPSDRECRGLRMIRTGNITSTSDADAADRWIDRVLAATTES